MVDKNIQERSRVLRIALDQGVLNLKELRSFLVSVEAELPPVTRMSKKKDGMQRQLAFLTKSKRPIHANI